MNRWLSILFLCLVGGAASAHKPSDSYLQLQLQGDALSGRWDIALRDLELAVGLDSDANGEITWGELRSGRKRVTAYALSRLRVSGGDVACQAGVSDLLAARHSDGVYASLALTFDCAIARGDDIAVRYALLFDRDPQHRGLLRFDNGAAVVTHVLSPSEPERILSSTTSSAWQTFREYVVEGVWHIWIGFDHVLFLFTLLLPAVLSYREYRWRSVDQLRPALIEVCRVVTAFTVAHSITLSLAVLDVVSLPSRPVEVAIAFSVLVTALNNLRPLFGARWLLAFVFGLIHGFGFAGVLADLGLQGGALALSLLGFNLGVELGQLAIVALMFPLAYAMRRTVFYRSCVMAGGSVAIAGIACMWMFERIYDYELIGF
ncbi:MAG: HupE/UreJ family protein [Gammaproteobacteria bacterium]